MSFCRDEIILRDLAKQVRDISSKEIQAERKTLWRRQNSLKKGSIPVLVQIGWWDVLKTEIITESTLMCEDTFLRKMEFNLRSSIFQDTVEDDTIIEPWFEVPAKFDVEGWGVKIEHKQPMQVGGTYKFNPPIKDEKDIQKLVPPKHSINEAATTERLERLDHALGDILPVVINRTPVFNGFGADISYWLCQLIGLEEIMFYVYDRPEWMHQLLAFLRDNILKVHEEAEKAGDWSLVSHKNQAMTYVEELPDPGPSTAGVGRNRLWGFFAAQEFALISPEMHDEFLLQYQLPIMEKMGLIAYGCCEDLTRKIGMLKKIPNLRRIAVTPWADVGKCADQIGSDYVMSWRPNPALMVCSDWDPKRIETTVKNALKAAKGCIVDISLKDVQTVKHELWRLKEWVRIVRESAES